MNMLEKAFRALRSWAGLDPVESRPTPAHGWLLPSVAEARRQVSVAVARRAERRGGRDGRD